MLLLGFSQDEGILFPLVYLVERLRPPSWVVVGIVLMVRHCPQSYPPAIPILETEGNRYYQVCGIGIMFRRIDEACEFISAMRHRNAMISVQAP